MLLSERAARTEKVLDRFRTRAFSWQGAHCVALAAAQAKAMGHKVPPVARFRSELGARKALAKRGAASVIELLDMHIARHPAPAFARTGDLVALPGDRDGEADPVFQAICVADGHGNLFGWHETDRSGLSPIKFAAADVLVAWKLGD